MQVAGVAGGGGGSDLCVGPQSFRSEVLPTTPPPSFLGKANPTRPASPNFQGAGRKNPICCSDKTAESGNDDGQTPVTGPFPYGTFQASPVLHHRLLGAPVRSEDCLLSHLPLSDPRRPSGNVLQAR